MQVKRKEIELEISRLHQELAERERVLRFVVAASRGLEIENSACIILANLGLAGLVLPAVLEGK